MKVALVHDYLRDFGGAERVLKALTEIYPDAPIYTAFCVDNSPAGESFKNKKIHESRFAPLIKHWRLYSPLRFLLPWIWKSVDLSEHDLVITSCSNYIARGFRVGKKTKVVAYCHTPPRFLYGYKTGLDWHRHWPVRVYGNVIGHFLRIFDFNSAQKIDCWIVNSKEVQARVKKFYRKNSTVIYPPIEVEKIAKAGRGVEREDYFLIASRPVGSKGIEETIAAANKLRIKLKIAGGVTKDSEEKNIELLGRVSDKKLWRLYAAARGFIALARDEDFGMTPVEAMAAGTPVIAFRGGGFKETVIDKKTGIFVDETDVKTLRNAFKEFEKTKWDKKQIQKHAQKFSKERFTKEIKSYIEALAQKTF